MRSSSRTLGCRVAQQGGTEGGTAKGKEEAATGRRAGPWRGRGTGRDTVTPAGSAHQRPSCPTHLINGPSAQLEKWLDSAVQQQRLAIL